MDRIAQSQAAAKEGIAALERGENDIAGLHFLSALQRLDDLADLGLRRALLSEIARLFLSTGFHDLALMAILDALEADRQLHLATERAADNITYATVHLRLANLQHADKIYRANLEDCLAAGQYGYAAGASTNLAWMLAENGYFEEATDLIRQGLSYFARTDIPDGEMRSRAMLLHLLEVQGTDPLQVLSEARQLLNKFGGRLPDQLREAAAYDVKSASNRYAEKDERVDANEYRLHEFPELFGRRQ